MRRNGIWIFFSLADSAAFSLSWFIESSIGVSWTDSSWLSCNIKSYFSLRPKHKHCETNPIPIDKVKVIIAENSSKFTFQLKFPHSFKIFKFGFPWNLSLNFLHFAGHSAPYFRKLLISGFFAFKFPAFPKEIMSVPYILSPPMLSNLPSTQRTWSMSFNFLQNLWVIEVLLIT